MLVYQAPPLVGRMQPLTVPEDTAADADATAQVADMCFLKYNALCLRHACLSVKPCQLWLLLNRCFKRQHILFEFVCLHVKLPCHASSFNVFPSHNIGYKRMAIVIPTSNPILLLLPLSTSLVQQAMAGPEAGAHQEDRHTHLQMVEYRPPPPVTGRRQPTVVPADKAAYADAFRAYSAAEVTHSQMHPKVQCPVSATCLPLET